MRVVLAEDFALLREGLARVLELHGFEIVAAVDNAPSLRRALLEGRADAAVVDVRLPPTFTDEGLHVALEVRARTPEKLIMKAVHGMIPKNRLGSRLLTKLIVYPGPAHPHQAQQPDALKGAE